MHPFVGAMSKNLALSLLVLRCLANYAHTTHTTAITAQDDATIFANAFDGWADFHEGVAGDTDEMGLPSASNR
jgi:hypothetical protein